MGARKRYTEDTAMIMMMMEMKQQLSLSEKDYGFLDRSGIAALCGPHPGFDLLNDCATNGAGEVPVWLNGHEGLMLVD